MPNENQLEYLKTQIIKQLNKRRSSTDFYRKRHFLTTVAAVVLSAIITVLAGLKSTIFPDKFSRIAILILGATSTVISAWGGFFSPGKSWLLEGEAYDNLRSLQTEIEFSEASPNFKSDEESVRQFFDRYQTIMQDYNKKWQMTRTKNH